MPEAMFVVSLIMRVLDGLLLGIGLLGAFVVADKCCHLFDEFKNARVGR